MTATGTTNVNVHKLPVTKKAIIMMMAPIPQEAQWKKVIRRERFSVSPCEIVPAIVSSLYGSGLGVDGPQPRNRYLDAQSTLHLVRWRSIDDVRY